MASSPLAEVLNQKLGELGFTRSTLNSWSLLWLPLFRRIYVPSSSHTKLETQLTIS